MRPSRSGLALCLTLPLLLCGACSFDSGGGNTNADSEESESSEADSTTQSSADEVGETAGSTDSTTADTDSTTDSTDTETDTETGTETDTEMDTETDTESSESGPMDTESSESGPMDTESSSESGPMDTESSESGPMDTESETGPEPQPYGECPNFQDDDCVMNEDCFVDELRNWEVCAMQCQNTAECPELPGFAAQCISVNANFQKYCFLSCEGGNTCPEGMQCENENVGIDKICIW